MRERCARGRMRACRSLVAAAHARLDRSRMDAGVGYAVAGVQVSGFSGADFEG